MFRVLFFSEVFKPIQIALKFAGVVAWRFVRVLFRRDKNIYPIRIAFSESGVFDNSYLYINYSFGNALWYEFYPLKITTEKGCAIFDMKNAKLNHLTLVVYGFFRKKSYLIAFNPQKTLDTSSFSTKLIGLSDLKLSLKAKETVPFPSPKVGRNIQINAPHFSANIIETAIKNTAFKLSDFI